MNYSVNIDHNSLVALGVIVIGAICAFKMDSDSITHVLTHVADAWKEKAMANNSNC